MTFRNVFLFSVYALQTCNLFVCGVAARQCCKPEPEGECRAACRRVFIGDSWRSSTGAMSHVTTHCPAHVTACVANHTSSHNQLSRTLRLSFRRLATIGKGYLQGGPKNRTVFRSLQLPYIFWHRIALGSIFIAVVHLQRRKFVFKLLTDICGCLVWFCWHKLYIVISY